MGAAMTDKPNPLTDPNDFTGPRNVLNELYATATAATDIAAAKAAYDETFPESPPAQLSTYQFRPARPPRPPVGRAMPKAVDGPIPVGRPVVYTALHVVDADIRNRVKRGYYK